MASIFVYAVTQEFVTLLQHAHGLQSMALAGSTKQYKAHMHWFAEFCVAAGCVDLMVRPPETLIMAYATYLFRDNLSPDTVNQYLKGLKDHYRSVGYTEFACPETWRGLLRTLKGMKRSKSHSTQQKQPITPEMLLRLGAARNRRQ